MAEVTGSKHVAKSTAYVVKDGVDVFLDVVVGKGQPGGISVALEDKPLKHAPEIKKLRLGRGDELRDKSMTVVAVVKDVSVLTNQTAVSLTLSGPAPKTIAATAEVDQGQVVFYTIVVNFL